MQEDYQARKGLILWCIMKNIFNVRHKPQTIEDFQKDIHRFTYSYNGVKEASCVSRLSVFFDDKLPEAVETEVRRYVWYLIDTQEDKWSLPNGAKELADAYCAEEFD